MKNRPGHYFQETNFCLEGLWKRDFPVSFSINALMEDKVFFHLNRFLIKIRMVDLLFDAGSLSDM